MSLSAKLFAALVLALPLLTGCDEDVVACTLIGCEDALYIDLAGPDGPLPEGDYTMNLKTAESDRTCPLTIKRGGVPADQGPGTCQVGGVNSDGGLRLAALRRVDSPVTVNVAREGVEVASVSVRPVYVGQFPNGPDCGEACQTATIRVEVP